MRNKINENEELICEKNQQIFLYQTNINTIINQNETLIEIINQANLFSDEKFDINSLNGLNTIKKLLEKTNKKRKNSIKIKNDDKISFFDKNIIRPIKGGFFLNIKKIFKEKFSFKQ